MKDLISVLMPTYNVADYVEEAVNSILNQTYDNFELIIVDDASTDGTFDILSKLQAKDSRIKLYRNEVNSKICKTLNRALLYAKGDFIARMDGDDISTNNRLEILYNFLLSHLDVCLVGSMMEAIDENGKSISIKLLPQNWKYINKGNKFMTSVTHIWLARRFVYEELKGYRDIPYVEDYDFLLRGEIKGFKYANVDIPVYKCRLRNGNTISSNGLLQRKSFYYVKKLHKKELKTGKDMFCEDDYKKAIACTDKQKKCYAIAAMYLNRAVCNKKRPFYMALNLIISVVKSRYILFYLISVVRFRLLMLSEKHKLG